MSRTFQPISLAEGRVIHVTFSACSEAHFARTAHFEDTRDANRLFAVLEGGRPIGWIQPARHLHRRVPLSPGKIYLIPRAQPLTMEFTAGTLLYAFHFQAVDAMEEDLFLDDGNIAPLPHDPAFFDEMKLLLSMGDDLARSMALRHFLLSRLWRALPTLSCARPRGATPEARFPDLFKRLEQIPPAAVKIRHLATAEGQTSLALSKAFRRAMGLPLKDFLMKRTLTEACRQLSLTDHPVRAIARDLGFPTEDAFSKFMKAHAGLAPSLWRTRHSLRPFT